MTYHTGNQLIDPYELFKKAHVQPDMHVADFGVGRTGHIVFPAARIVGEKGLVYAVDIQKDVLNSIEKRANMEGFVNIQTVWADIERAESVLIPRKSLDAIFLVNVLYHFSELNTVLSEAARLMKDKGRVVVADWTRRIANLGPAPDEMLDFGKLKNTATELGFLVQEETQLSTHHRCMVLYRHT